MLAQLVRGTRRALRSHSLVELVLEGHARNLSLLQVQVVVLALTLGVITPLVYFYLPGYFYLLRKEDHLVEHLSAGFALGATFLALYIYCRQKHHHKFLILVVVLGVLFFLDEISFGKRFFNLQSLELFGSKIDAVHDIIDVAVWQLKETSLQMRVFLLIGASVAGATLFVRHRRWLADAVRATFKSEPFILLAMFAVLIVAAQVLDQLAHINVHLGSFSLSQATEEVLEMNAAIALSLCVLSFRTNTLPYYPTFPR